MLKQFIDDLNEVYAEHGDILVMVDVKELDYIMSATKVSLVTHKMSDKKAVTVSCTLKGATANEDESFTEN